ncbi:hypothetical protein TNCT_369761 [Trichonephila clavata]|uniref:C2H2-type domain-containing protein n=1 Tax=Trichonephila clavata TaxID=2740835 RepID=A0A8X6I0N5_TRICU|nr:hypothetical protein TNCT_369761 [Trichonephila clavata]
MIGNDIDVSRGGLRVNGFLLLKFLRYDVHQTHHQLLHALKHKKVHPCTFCEFVAPYQSTLKLHMFRKHFEEKPLGCGVCGKGKRGKVHQCPYCHVVAPFLSSLKLHIIRKHIEEKPFKCHICGKDFATKFQLQRHSICHR